jgi:hypothetical protein
MTAIAGIATAAIMIDDMQFFSPPPVTPAAIANTVSAPVISHETDFSLLDAEQRRSLTALRAATQQIPSPAAISDQPVIETPIRVTQSLSAPAHPELLLDTNKVIPKYVRSLNLSLEITHASEPLTLRWLWRNQLIHSETLSQTQLRQPIARQISLFSAGIGPWQIELLDPSENVVYRYQFNYINQFGS